MNYFIYGGRSSEELGLLITGKVFGSPERDVEYITIPGRSGDLMVDNNRYRNYTISYDISPKS